MAENYIDGYVRTISAALAASAAQANKPHIPLPFSTLNELFDIHTDETVADSDRYVTSYVCIGIGGHDFTYGSQNLPLNKTIPHLPRHTGLYYPMPFVLREVNDDLSSVERAKYRLRRLETINGKVYVAYYARKLDLSDTVVKAELRKVVDGEVVAAPFTPALADLKPSKPTITENSVLTTTGDYVAATLKVVFSMTPAEIEEFHNVCMIKFGNIGYATISEVALVQGVDRAVSGDFNGQMMQYTDVIGAQVAYFISSSFQTVTTNREINITMDLGNVEPLLEITSG